MDCNQCGEHSTDFREGVCIECFEDNQNALDEHNTHYDWWENLSTDERDTIIRNSI